MCVCLALALIYPLNASPRQGRSQTWAVWGLTTFILPSGILQSTEACRHHMLEFSEAALLCHQSLSAPTSPVPSLPVAVRPGRHGVYMCPHVFTCVCSLSEHEPLQHELNSKCWVGRSSQGCVRLPPRSPLGTPEKSPRVHMMLASQAEPWTYQSCQTHPSQVSLSFIRTSYQMLGPYLTILPLLEARNLEYP